MTSNGCPVLCGRGLCRAPWWVTISSTAGSGLLCLCAALLSSTLLSVPLCVHPETLQAISALSSPDRGGVDSSRPAGNGFLAPFWRPPPSPAVSGGQDHSRLRPYVGALVWVEGMERVATQVRAAETVLCPPDVLSNPYLSTLSILIRTPSPLSPSCPWASPGPRKLLDFPHQPSVTEAQLIFPIQPRNPTRCWPGQCRVPGSLWSGQLPPR